MKLSKIYIVNIIFTFLVALNSFSCTMETDNEKEWGIAQVYMPQASVLNGGDNNSYLVPNNASFKNYSIDTLTNTIHIVLGVSRTGLQSLEEFSIKVKADIEASNDIIAGGSISNSILLPSDVFTLPTEVSVPSNQRSTTFLLSIDINKLMENYHEYNSKTMVLVVAISDPTNYVVNPSLSHTTIIIDSKAFMPG